MRRPPATAACLLRGLVVMTAVLTTSPCLAQDRDPYDEARDQADALERRGDLAGAAGILEAARAGYPQDYDLALRLGWLRFRAGAYAAAERAYAAALATGGAPAEALLGLAWSRQRLGRCAEALPAFQRALAAAPGDRRAAAGLAACAPPRRVRGTAAATVAGQALAGASSGYGLSAATALDLLVRDRLTAGLTYRYRHLFLSGAGVSPARQHEAYARLGYGAARLGVTVHYALLIEQSSTTAPAPSHHAGVTARFSPFGDGLLAASVSLYRDLAAVRVQPSWRFPLPGGFSITPGGAYEWTSSGSRASGFLHLALDRRRFSLFAGGRAGNELRPAHLDLGVISNYGQPLVGAAWVGGAVNLRVRLELGWSLDLLREGVAGAITQMHVLHLGVSHSF